MTDETAEGIERPELDLRTLTLGEMAAVELASGESFDRLMRGTAGRWLVALYVQRSRSSGLVPSWSDLSSLRPLGSASSSSRSRPDGSPTRSPG